MVDFIENSLIQFYEYIESAGVLQNVKEIGFVRGKSGRLDGSDLCNREGSR